MSQEKREFKGVWFPKEVWLDERLTAIEKIILLEIDSLDNEDGCYASNEYLAKFCQCSQTKVSVAISKLKGLEYVTVASFDGRKRVLHSSLTKNVRHTHKNSESPHQKKEERILDDNPSENTKDNGNKDAEEIISYLNDKTGKHYRNVASARRLIQARRNEGYTVDDFKKVIDNKVASWAGTDMEQYIRPATLFSASHFDDYLNETKRRAKQGGGAARQASDLFAKYDEVPESRRFTL